MGRKHFQDLANVMCQKFVDCASNTDHVDLAILGSGTLELFITDDKAMHNGHAVEPLPFAAEWLEWAEGRLDDLRIPRSELRRAVFRVSYTVTLAWRDTSIGGLTGWFQLACTSLVATVDREYIAELTAEKQWGLSQVSIRRARVSG